MCSRAQIGWLHAGSRSSPGCRPALHPARWLSPGQTRSLPPSPESEPPSSHGVLEGRSPSFLKVDGSLGSAALEADLPQEADLPWKQTLLPFAAPWGHSGLWVESGVLVPFSIRSILSRILCFAQLSYKPKTSVQNYKIKSFLTNAHRNRVLTKCFSKGLFLFFHCPLGQLCYGLMP